MKNLYLLALLTTTLFISCKKHRPPKTEDNKNGGTKTESTAPAVPKFIAQLGAADPKSQIQISWKDHTDFGTVNPATPAYKLEISTDGQTFTTLPSGNIKMNNVATPSSSYTADQLLSAVKEVLITGLDYTKEYYFKLTATNVNKASTTYTSPEPVKMKIADIIQQTQYQSEEYGAPARPSWVDAFRHYPEINFFKNGRYPLVWRKDPGNPGPKNDYNPAVRWELHRINFKDPESMKADAKFGMPISVNDVQSSDVVVSQTANPQEVTNRTIELPKDILPANDRSADASANYAPIQIPAVAHTQYGYVPVNGTAMAAVVAYKIRLYRTINDVDAQGKPITKEVYNDSKIIFVNWRDGKTKIADQTASGDGGGAAASVVPDVLVTMDDVRKALSLPAGAYFKQDWEARKITGKTPLEELMTKENFEALFPENIRKQGHDKDGTYYSWENLVTASRYFPKFLNEGSKEDRYRELAAILGNKSHETGDGWPALGEQRWSYGLFWIVELAALGGNINPANKEDLYKAYSSAYTQAGNTSYPAVTGKSYHGRGPVQLSWNYNYGQMSEVLWGKKNILLENPNLIARDGVLGWASAIWFWMEPQSQKPSAHDVMVGNVDLSEPYAAPTQRNDPNYGKRTHTASSKGHKADGTPVSYQQLAVPSGLEVGFGLTINIINGGLESNVGKMDNRQARRIGFFARYLDYFGTVKKGRNDGANLPVSPAVSNNGGVGGDPVPAETIETMKGWRTWHNLPGDGLKGTNDFPSDAKIPSILSSVYQGSLY